MRNEIVYKKFSKYFDLINRQKQFTLMNNKKFIVPKEF